MSSEQGSLPEIVRILVVEDSPDDFFMTERELKRGGLSCELKRVETPEDLQESLLSEEWDIIISDYSLPRLNALEALRIVQGSRPDVPFVAVSGSIGEELAVELIRAGANDYLMKDRLARLPAVVLREVREAGLRRERARMERELRHLQKIEALGMLAGGIAHDFNNVLTAIAGYTELAGSKLEDGHPAQDDIAQVMLAAGRSREIVKRILSFSRKQDDTAPAERFDLYQPVANALNMLRPALPPMVKTRFDAAPAQCFTMGLASEVEQAVLNLCTNSAHAIGQHDGQIELRLRAVHVSPNAGPALLAEGDYCLLTVTDSGSGMPPEVQARIFEPFYTTKPDGQGTGLGLSMVHKLITAMGGMIVCDSLLGVGTTFSIYMPQLAADGAEGSPAVPNARVKPGAGERIMVLDDEELLVNVTALMLTQGGFKPTKFFDPNSALAAFRSNPGDYDLLVTDLAMPGMTGLELTKMLREIRADLPVVLSTGYVGPAESEILKQCTAVLTKPYTREALYSAVLEALGKPLPEPAAA
jgi:signal transduction histidine kinase